MTFNTSDASYQDLKDYAKLYEIKVFGVKKEDLRKAVSDHMESASVVTSQPKIETMQVVSTPLDDTSLSGKQRTKIIIHESQNPNAVNPVFVGVNGIGYTINRGEEVEVPVGVVEALNNARETLYDRKKDELGREYLSARQALSYPFSILG